MNDTSGSRRLAPIAAIALLAAILGFAGGWAWQASGLGKGATEEIVHGYIMEHPEILPQAIQRLQDREMAQRIEPLRQPLEMAYPGAVLGNPQGSVVLVEFSDYACPYCKTSVSDIEALIAKNEELKVVLRHDPVLSAESEVAAQMALAAADQGKFPAFHKAMFAKDRLSDETIDAAAQEAGMDVAKARSDMESGKYDMELDTNRQLARAVGFSGTPSWVIGDQAMSGAVGQNTLQEAISQAKES